VNTLSSRPMVGRFWFKITRFAKVVADRFVEMGRDLPGVDGEIHVDRAGMTGAGHQERRNPAAHEHQMSPMPAEHSKRLDKHRLARGDRIVVVIVQRHHVGMIFR